MLVQEFKLGPCHALKPVRLRGALEFRLGSPEVDILSSLDHYSPAVGLQPGCTSWSQEFLARIISCHTGSLKRSHSPLVSITLGRKIQWPIHDSTWWGHVMRDESHCIVQYCP